MLRTFIFFLTFVFSLAHTKEQQIVAVVGAGPAGLSAANTCQAFGFQTILFKQTKEFESKDVLSFWPGLTAPKWDMIIQNARDSFTKAGGLILNKEVRKIHQTLDAFILSTSKETFSVKALIIATGQQPSPTSFLYKQSDRIYTNVWSEKIFTPKDSVIIIGQGKPLLQATLQAARSAGTVFLFPYASNTVSLDSLVKIFPTLSIIRGVSISDIGSSKGKAFISYFQGQSKLYKEASYLIVAEEKTPSSSLVENLCSLDSSKAIITTTDTGATTLPGLYACGEVTQKEPLTGLQAFADGQKVALAVVNFLIEKEIPPKKRLFTPLPKEEKPSIEQTEKNIPE